MPNQTLLKQRDFTELHVAATKTVTSVPVYCSMRK